jgi:protein phosphatase
LSYKQREASVLGISHNSRGVSVCYGVDMVDRFCRDNGLDVIVRAHECVQAGFEYFARGHLITVFSATNYCGQSGNQGALLHVVDRGADWLIIPKVIEPQGAGAWYVVAILDHTMSCWLVC